MAEVFRAVVSGAEGFRRRVVLKRILSERARSAAFIEMFVREARISALMHHPNIVQVFDFGQVEGSYFLAMELVDGWEVGAVNRALRRTRAKMPIEIALHIAHQVLLGLSYAHTLQVEGCRQDIVHRDISPSNIMCLRAGGVKLLDFGVASTGAVRGASQDQKPAFCGKLAYAAPEYVRGEGQDARIDIFSMGVVLWESLVGERLFRGKTPEQTLRALFDKPIVAPSARRPAVPAEIDRIVLRALERDPELRYQSAASMAEDLEQVLSDRRHQSQALPRLLNDLFGDVPPSVTAVTAVEELLQSEVTVPPASLSGRSRPSLASALHLRRSGWAYALALAGAAAMLFFWLFREPARLVPAVALAIGVATPRLAPVVEAIGRPAPARRLAHATQSGATGVVGRAGGATPARGGAGDDRWRKLAAGPVRKAAPVKLRAPALDRADLLGGARAVDPFAEASARRGRR